MLRNCPKCKAECEGEDLGDHPAFLTFDCECGHIWGENVMAEMVDDARTMYKYRGL